MAEVVSSTLVKVDAPQIRARLMALKEELIRRALAKGVIKTRGEAVIRDLLPETDFGLANEVWVHSQAAANTWERYYDGTKRIEAVLVEDKVIGIIGMRNDAADPKVVVIRFGLGWPLTVVRGVFHVQSQYLEPEIIALFSKDIIYEKGEKITIEVYGRAAGADGTAFIGLVCEPKGVTVSE